MLKRISTSFLLSLLCWGITVSTASAQFGGNQIDYPFGRPTVSPYLNLIGNSSAASAGINYYGLVRPQQQFYQQSEDLRQGLYGRQTQQNQQLQNRGQRMQSGYKMGVTGHSTSFRTFNAVSQQPGGQNGQSGTGQFGSSQFGSSQIGGLQTDGDSVGNQFGSAGYSGHGSGFGYGAAYNQGN